MKQDNFPERVSMEIFSPEVQEFYRDIRDFIFNAVVKAKHEDRGNIISAAVTMSVNAFYRLYACNPAEDRVSIEKDIEKMLHVACELAREAVWKEELN